MMFGQSCFAIQLAGETLVKQLWSQVRELVVLTQAMGDVDAQGDFDALQRIQGEQSQFLVEHI